MLRWLAGIYSGHALKVLALVVFSAVTNNIGPIIIQYAIDHGYKGKNITILVICILLFFASKFISYILSYIQRLFVTGLSAGSLHKLRVALFRHVLRLPMKVYERFTSGQLVVRCIGDVDSLTQFIHQGINILGSVITIAFVMLIMLYYSVQLTMVTLAGLLIGSLFYNSYRKSLYSVWHKLREELSVMGGFISEAVSGMRIIRLFVQEERIGREYRRLHKNFTSLALNASMKMSIFYPMTGFIYNVYLCLLLWMGGYLIEVDSITFGTFIAFWYLLNKFIAPIRQLADQFNTVVQASASKKRVDELMNEEVERSGGIDIGSIKSIEFSDIRFSYDGEVPVLKGVSFKLEPSDKVALVGKTGSGKSTIVSLLFGLYTGYDGKVFINGTELGDVDLSILRKRIAYIDQSYDVSENISPGELQRKKIEAIKGRDVDVIILDEATSNIDPVTERDIQRMILNKFKEKIVIVISHRLSSIRSMEKVLYLSDGVIKGKGALVDMLKNNGPVHGIFKQQLAKIL